MKNFLRKNLLAICTACLALDLWVPFPVISTFLFGEPDFPYEED